jgi:fatty-acyl-CoA synthase
MKKNLAQLVARPERHPEFRTIPEGLIRACELWGAQESLVIEGQRLTYQELLQQVQHSALSLSRLGLGPGDHIALCMGNCVKWVVLAYAVHWIGGVVIPVNTRFKAEELRYCLHQSDTKLLFVVDRFLNIDFIKMLASIAPALNTQLPDAGLPLLKNVVVLGDDVPRGAMPWEAFSQLGEGALAPASRVAPLDVALIQYTSGTTSFPKGAMLTHQNLILDAWHVSKRLGLNSTDRYFSGRPLFHVAGTTLSMIASMVSGACYITSASFHVPTVIEVMKKELCTMTSANETMFLMLMSDPDFATMNLNLRGGMAAVGSEVAHQLVERFGMTDIGLGYGLSESSPNCVLTPYDEDPEKRLNGYALPLYELDVKIFQENSTIELNPGEPGEICIRGWSVMKGYYNMPDATAKAIDKDGWLHTGDMGVADEDGRICFIDRMKDMFRVGGENVAPADVENVLNGHPEVKQSQVVGVPDKRLLQVPAAYVIKVEGSRLTEEELMAWTRERCAGFKVPRYVKFIDTFENIGMTASAKVQRNKLLAQALLDFGFSQK